MNHPLLDVQGLCKIFPSRAGAFGRASGEIPAVDGVSFHIDAGETLGLVGESGCGKTTTGRMIARLIEPTAGSIRFHDNGRTTDLRELRGKALRQFRRHIQFIFQDPYSSLDPRMTVFDSIAEPLRAHRFGTRREIEQRVMELAEAAGLQTGLLRRYPHAFSGGQRQRIGIARALAPHPKLIVCDEPVSALDVSIQAQIVNLLQDLQQRLGVAYLFVAHDLAVVEHISHRVAVMYAGRIVEMAPAETLFQRPAHPYTRALLAAAPKPDPEQRDMPPPIEGEAADPTHLPEGCAFAPRCPAATAQCRQERPILRIIAEEHSAACHYAERNV